MVEGLKLNRAENRGIALLARETASFCGDAWLLQKIVLSFLGTIADY